MLREFSIPKAGNTEDENEDQSRRNSTRGNKRRHFALSDGATESPFSREWARCLVEAYGDFYQLQRAQMESDPPDIEWIGEARRTFAEIHNQHDSPWYTKAKMEREGSFATFLGVVILHYKRRQDWIAIACGDTCVFHVVDERIDTSFPFATPDDFGNRPDLIPTHRDLHVPALKKSPCTPWKNGDQFVLATDAVSRWLVEDSADDCRVRSLLKCETNDDFAELIRQERASGRIKNDDSTVIMIDT